MTKEVKEVFQKFNQEDHFGIKIKSFFIKYSTYFLFPSLDITTRFEVIITEISYCGKVIKMEERNGVLLPATPIPKYWEERVEEFLAENLNGKMRTNVEYLPRVYICHYPERLGFIIYQVLRGEKEAPCWYISSEIQSVSSGLFISLLLINFYLCTN